MESASVLSLNNSDNNTSTSGHNNNDRRQEKSHYNITSDDSPYQFVMVFPVLFEYGDFPYFDQIFQGCASADVSGALFECRQRGPREEDLNWNATEFAPTVQAQFIRDLVDDSLRQKLTRVDGISVCPFPTGSKEAHAPLEEAIQYANQNGIPTITFMVDVYQESVRRAFVPPTSGEVMGMEMGKVLQQLRPTGGKYGIIADLEYLDGSDWWGVKDSQRISGLRYRLERDPLYPNAWTEVDYSPLNTNWSSTYLGIDEMYQYAKDPDIEAIVSVNPIVSYDAEAVRQFARDHPDIIVTLVAEELEQDQADLIEEGYVDAIVAEMPAEMGTMSAEILLRLNQQRPIPRPLYGRHMLELLRVPLLLPEANIDLHLLGNLQYLGVVLFGIVALYCFIVVGWINWNRKSATVISAQPPFLYMIVAGTLILASSIIPMAVDDDTFNDAKAMFESTEDIIQANATDDVTYSGIHFGEEGIKSGEETTTPADVACRVFPWLASIGFSTAMAALFSKTWRVVRLMDNAKRFKRIQIKPVDVMAPYAVLMVLNIIVLTLWTVLAPMYYIRNPLPGTDEWNRALDFAGRCKSLDNDGTPYEALLPCNGGIVLVMANVYAYRSRKMQEDLSEARHIAIIDYTLLQAALIMCPVIFLVQDDPRASFLIKAFAIFAVCLSILSFIFLPKMYALHQVGKRNQNATTEFTEKYSPPEKASSGQNYGQQWIHNHQVNNTPIDVTQGDNNDSQSNENRNCAEDVEVSNGSDKANTSPHNHRIDLTSASNVDADSPMAGQQIHDDANADAIMEDVQSLVMLMRDEEKCALKKIIELPTENRRQLMNALLLFDQLPSEQRDSLASSY